jgi:DNA polymerase-3 subunit alpha
MRDDGMNLHAYSIFSPDVVQGGVSGPLTLTMPDARATTELVTQLGGILTRHSGDAEVRLKLVRGDVARVFEVPYPVKVTPDLFGELKSLLGPNCLG